MGHAYTPGLTVAERALVRRKRLLPIPGTVLARQGDPVRAGTVVAHAELAGKVHVANLANLLGVAPDEVRDYLVKPDGHPVRRGEVIAETRPLLKWLKAEVRSPIEGRLESVSTVTGQALLREPPRSLDLLAYVDGTVVEIHPGQGVTVETECSLVQGIFGIGGETWGPLIMGVKSPDEPLTADKILPSMKGQIVVGGAFLGADTMTRAREVGVAGLVVGGIHDKDLRALLGYDLGVAITGTERVGFTLVLTEGFGVIPMLHKTFTLLAGHAGRHASLSGATQIRAGVIRPEIIIPRRCDSAPAERPAGASSADEPTGLKVGDLVRVIRDPLFGRVGHVAGLPPDLKEIETGSRTRVLEVEFAGGTRAVIPRANVEIIEG